MKLPLRITKVDRDATRHAVVDADNWIIFDVTGAPGACEFAERVVRHANRRRWWHWLLPEPGSREEWLWKKNTFGTVRQRDPHFMWMRDCQVGGDCFVGMDDPDNCHPDCKAAGVCDPGQTAGIPPGTNLADLAAAIQKTNHEKTATS